MGLLVECKKHFGTTDLFKVLQVKENASNKDVKKAFFEKSKLYHPDKCSDASATEKFQILNRLYSILSDEDKRKIYLETGDVDEDSTLVNISDWKSFWSAFFPKVDLKAVDKLKSEYVGSEQERKDIKENYVKFKGDMNSIMESTMFAEIEREDEIREIINELISSGEVEAYKKYTNESAASKMKRKKDAEKDRNEMIKDSKKSKPKPDLEDLAIAIRSRQQKECASFLDSLEAKYAPKPKKSRTK
ncbi:hypothetical protein Ciccas_009734 [Cichlidogyrus casuarinus]|uniref:J domain-containing protein n=1 Tax=Cichlidogyrus casuarinus TaxID=1844966 RepID=A0ABD2PW62_9PLAT